MQFNVANIQFLPNFRKEYTEISVKMNKYS